MGFTPGMSLLGHTIDYVFLGACTNGRIEDFRAFTSIVKGKKKADHVTAWLVPGSWAVMGQIKAEGLDTILHDAGFSIRPPGCSACLAMNDDKRSEEHTSELQSRQYLVCRLLLEKKQNTG